MTKMREFSQRDLSYVNIVSNGLTKDSKFKTISEASVKLLGIHSARISTPYISTLSRVTNVKAEEVHNQTFNSRKLIKLRCMRGTLHTACLTIAPILHSATMNKRKNVCRALYKKSGVTATQFQDRKYLVLRALEGTVLDSRAIEYHISSQSRELVGIEDKILTRIAIKELWEEGQICYTNRAIGLNREARAYGLTRKIYPTLDLNAIPAEEAYHLLIASYFATYGPATLADAAWWVGDTSAKVHRTISNIKDIRSCTVQGHTSPFYYFESHYQSCSKAESEIFENNINLLAYEDPYLKAYNETRSRYIDMREYHNLFNAIGEARASIMCGGRVVGLWAWNLKSRKIEYTLFQNSLVKDIGKLSSEIYAMETAILSLEASALSSRSESSRASF